jgi:hypothetical protein
MPYGDLYTLMTRAVEKIVEKRAGAAIAQRAPIDSVSEDGTLIARVDGKVVRAQLATEEPLLKGETAWISKTKDGNHIAHGSAH